MHRSHEANVQFAMVAADRIAFLGRGTEYTVVKMSSNRLECATKSNARELYQVPKQVKVRHMRNLMGC